MEVNGSIFIDKEGIVFSNVEPNQSQLVVKDFSDVLKEANVHKDKMFYIRSKEWDEFFLKSQYPKDNYWNGAGQIANQLLFNYGNPVFHRCEINNIGEFDLRNPPRIHGGIQYKNCPTDYVYDKQSIDNWHDSWFNENPNKIDWTSSKNHIWPRYDRTVNILIEEIRSKGIKISKAATEKEIIDNFHEQVMKPMDERERISYAKTISSKVCEANHYHRETILEKLKSTHGNKNAEIIYSIKIDTKYQFLSIDKQHGMLELCDDKGDHQMEIRFDGTQNKKKEVNHSLQCIAEWKHQCNK